MTVLTKAIEIVQSYLDSKEVHITINHSKDNQGGLNDNKFDYTGYISYPIPVEDAFGMELIWITDGKIMNSIAHLPLFPIELDYIKIRRRCEDYLRKTNDNSMLLQVAHLLSIKLD